MKVFYVVQFGKHLGRFVLHVFIRAEGNYYQYALHHGLSTFLIFFSFDEYVDDGHISHFYSRYQQNCYDVCRGYRDYRKVNRKLLTLIDILGLLLWVFCRIFLLSYCCVYSSFNSFYQFITYPEKFNPIIKHYFLLASGFMVFMLFSL